MQDLEAIRVRAQELLNQSLIEYEAQSSGPASEFFELKLQAAMFQYEICAEMACFVRSNPIGFARNVSLKGLIHRLYEYDQLLSTHLISRLLVLAKARGADIESADVKTERKKWRAQLGRLKRWSDVRNQATGHYGRDIARQIQLVKSVSQEEVMSVTEAFLSFDLRILNILRTAGRGNSA